jgi:predicted CXXCH cytochrome family protein
VTGIVRWATARGLITRILLTVLSAGLPANAQDSDTVILKDAHQNFTILSRVEDPQERKAFIQAYKEKDPSKRHSLAATFIKTYPKSWLLSEAYDLAAKSSIDLGDYRSALQEGRFSLRLSPENATLLVLIANIEAQNKLYDEAETSARDALEYLDKFARPGNLSDRQWSRLKPKLKASAYFALARDYAARGFANRESSRMNLLTQAEKFLDYAAAWNRDDPEIFYLRGLVELELSESKKASADLMFVARMSDPLREKALGNLRRVYKSKGAEARVPKPEINDRLRDERPEAEHSAAIREGYAGPSACQTCHAREYETWRQTGMARMFRAYKAENVFGDFSPGNEFRDKSGNALIRMGIDSRPYFEIRQRGGGWQRFHVDYTIGSKWQQGYATKVSDGSFHVLPIEYNVLRKAWINYWEVIDPPGSKRAIITDFPNLRPETNYQENCAICHTSQLRAASSDKNAMEHAVFLQPGVDCEMCHGPSAWHIREIRAGHLVKKPPSEPPVDFRILTNRDGVRICAQCHRQAAIREVGRQNEMNYAAERGNFVPKAWVRPYDAFSRRAFYKDGRFRETTFIVEAFTRSACYRKGTAQCVSCHSPHVGDFPHNLTSLKFKGNLNEMCLGCHAQYRGHITDHTHHASNSEGTQCVSCHMPRIVNALLFKARSHEIQIPRADLTERFGQEESPNACLVCHSEKSAGWAGQQLQKWQG